MNETAEEPELSQRDGTIQLSIVVIVVLILR